MDFNVYDIKMSDKTLNYVLTGLELYCINLNNSYFLMDIDFDIRNEAYADVFYTYHYFLSMTDSKERIRLEKPRITKKNKSDYIKFLDSIYYSKQNKIS